MNWQQDIPWNQQTLSQLGTLAEAGQLGHAYLLQGQAGLGKESLAMELSMRLFCSNESHVEACGACQNCRLFLAGTHPDFKNLQVEEGSTQIKIEQVRDSLNFLANTPLLGKNKILLLSPAEALNINAANALLKNLEEPTPGTIIILISHQPGRLLPTIRSRCQQIKIAQPDKKQALDFLQQFMPPGQASRSLALANGAPLKAVEYADEAKQDEVRAVHKSLLQLVQGESAINTAILAISKMAPGFIIEYMLLGVQELSRNLQSQSSKQDTVFSTLELQELASLLKGEHLLALHLFYHELLQARRAAQSTANPNAQLLIESLCYRWFTLVRQPESRKVSAGALLA